MRSLEEEIFYPAVREVTEDELIRESMAEHQEMKRLIGLLRRMEPEAIDYDETVMALMREVLHHVADEETVVLPAAERLLGDSLGELGARMTKRRVQLVAPRSGEIALDMGAPSRATRRRFRSRGSRRWACCGPADPDAPGATCRASRPSTGDGPWSRGRHRAAHRCICGRAAGCPFGAGWQSPSSWRASSSSAIRPSKGWRAATCASRAR